MNIHSLGLKTDLIHDRFSGVITDRGDYLLIQTPTRTNYYWGNYLLMDKPPQSGDLDRWIKLFEQEIGPRSERGYMAVCWDGVDGELGDIEPFVAEGFTLQTSTILTARSVCKPPNYNPDLVVRPFASDADWDCFVDIHFDPDWLYGDADSQRAFIRDGRDDFRAWVDTGQAMRFGVEGEGGLVGEAGLYWEDQLGRFNNVATHPDHRNQGICRSLIYEMSRHAFETLQLETLVMEADDAYDAAKIYEAIGFVPTEKVVKLQWVADRKGLD